MFCKIFKSKAYQQIVVMRCQDNDGSPEVRFFFQPEGMGVCQFAIGPRDDDDRDDQNLMDAAFEAIKGAGAHEMVFAWVRQMEAGGVN
jgi:hypothetical protein